MLYYVALKTWSFFFGSILTYFVSYKYVFHKNSYEFSECRPPPLLNSPSTLCRIPSSLCRMPPPPSFGPTIYATANTHIYIYNIYIYIERSTGKNNRNQIIITIFRLICNKTELHLAPNQSANGKYKLILVDSK